MKKAYTLSEVLVVLLVLGIIAAFIIPAVMRTAPDRSSLLYKKTFYSTQEAVSQVINDPKLYPTVDATTGSIINNGKGYFSDARKFCLDMANALNIIGEASCDGTGAAGNPNFTTTNGVKWWGLGGAAFAGGDAEAGSSYKEISVECSGTQYRIKIFSDGRVGIEDDWDLEKKILKTPFKFRDMGFGEGNE